MRSMADQPEDQKTENEDTDEQLEEAEIKVSDETERTLDIENQSSSTDAVDGDEEEADDNAEKKEEDLSNQDQTTELHDEKIITVEESQPENLNTEEKEENENVCERNVNGTTEGKEEQKELAEDKEKKPEEKEIFEEEKKKELLERDCGISRKEKLWRQS